jgi:DeoR/GlpR family transcriptional regulator of sugar metabolism
MTTTDPNEAYTKQQVLTHAAKKVLLADSSKFGVRSFARVGEAADLDVFVTETITKTGREQLRKLGVELLLADLEEN